MNPQKRIVISKFLLAIFLLYVVGCNYYKISTHRSQEEIRTQMMASINENKNFILVQGTEQWGINSIILDNYQIKMHVGTMSPEIKKMHDKIEARKSTRYKKITDKATGYTERPILQEVRIFVEPSIIVTKGNINIPISAVERIDIYDNDSGKTSASYVFGTLGITFGVIILLGVIVALTKSSCPFIYSYNGEEFTFEGESYGGAIFAPLERSDYIPLKYIEPFKETYLLRISNELKEKQFINFIEMINVFTAPDATALVDKYGYVYSIKTPEPVLKATSSANTVYTDAILYADNKKYLFNEGEENTSYLICQFPMKNGAGEGKLIVQAKGSLWLDYVYGEFIKKMGDFYSEFSRRQNLRTREELEQWSFDQEIPLKVYILKNNEWQYVDHFPIVGPLGEPRKMVMKLDLTNVPNETVIIKLETGNMFWEVDYAGLDYSVNEVINIEYLNPSESFNQDGSDILSLISSDDMNYLQQLSAGEYANVKFRIFDDNSGLNLSSILHIKGYYEHIRDFKGIPDFFSLAEFKKPGAFTAFSKNLYCEKENIIYPGLISENTY